jgi:hypothetical protein
MKLTIKEQTDLISRLQSRFEKNMSRHSGISWSEVLEKLHASDGKLWSLNKMEQTGGEPDVVAFDKKKKKYIFYDCSPESPAGRRNLCYDHEALLSRKEFKPENNVLSVAEEMGIEILNEEQYKMLQGLGSFDLKTSSWLKTPDEVRKLGGAIFGDRRYNRVFIYHNGAQSYYASRGFRGWLSI